MVETKGGFLISQIKQIQGRIFEKLLQEAGITDFNGPQGRILFVLWKQDDISIVEISGKTGLAKTTLTSMLDRMEKQGHIERHFDPEDRRRIRIRLTDQARGTMDRYQEVSDEMSSIFYKGFTNEEIIGFDRQLEKILRNLETDYIKSSLK
jgi:DNA-binding MarR family transcriptional regulator